MHLLPEGFHRIRHCGLLTNGGITRAEKLACAPEPIAAFNDGIIGASSPRPVLPWRIRLTDAIKAVSIRMPGRASRQYAMPCARWGSHAKPSSYAEILQAAKALVML
jgi:hypothetical protein